VRVISRGTISNGKRKHEDELDEETSVTDDIEVEHGGISFLLPFFFICS